MLKDQPVILTIGIYTVCLKQGLLRELCIMGGISLHFFAKGKSDGISRLYLEA